MQQRGSGRQRKKTCSNGLVVFTTLGDYQQLSLPVGLHLSLKPADVTLQTIQLVSQAVGLVEKMVNLLLVLTYETGLFIDCALQSKKPV